MEVNLYIETTAERPGIYEIAGMWILEYITSTGNPVTRSGILHKKGITNNAITLELLRDALSRLTKSCSVRVNTRCGHVLGVMRNHYLPMWKKNGWMTAKHAPVKNAELWQQVSELLENHYVTVDDDDHSYRQYMQEQLQKELSKEIGGNEDV